jgi:hypothetical protein
VVESLRARAFERLLPPLVHRLNNAIAVFQGVFELGAGASERDRENARKELSILSTSLARLALLARAPSTRQQVLALDPIGQSCALLLRPLAQTLQVDFTVRARSGLSARTDARLESLLFVAAFELIQALAEQESGPQRLRLSIEARRGCAALVLTASGPVALPCAAPALAELARERGLSFRQRTGPRGTSLRVLLPLLFDRVVPAERPRVARRRVLLIQEDGQDRELAATLLREQGCEVREQALVPSDGQFELVLLDERVLAGDPEAAARLARVAYRRLEHIRPPLRPAQLLEFLQT